MGSSSASDLLCPDWVFSTASNVHACKDRDWFTDYTPFESFVGSIYFDKEKIPVAGVGTVVLPVKKSPHRSGSDAHGQLVLHNVVHCPSAICNIIGYTPAFVLNNDLVVSFAKTSKSMGTIKDKQGHSVAYFAPNKDFLQVKLSGPPVGPIVGPSGLHDGVFILNVRWSESEQARWETYTQSRGSPSLMQSENGTVQEHSKDDKVQPPQPSAPYTAYEKQWLKVHYGNEYRHLQAYGLSIFKDEDREEGRAMIRQFMADEGPEGKELVLALLGKDEASDNESHTSDEDPEESMADHLFDAKSLPWTRHHYGTSMNFMRSFGLKIYDLDDCDEAQAIASGMIEDEKELHVDSEEDDEDDENDEDDEDAEVDLEGHLTDYHFDEESLNWIEKHFGNSMNFMYSYGLKFYNDDDCAEAANIARALAR